MSTEGNARLQAQGELRGSVLTLLGLLVVAALAARGTFSSAWYFPHVFGSAMVVLSAWSLRTAWGELRVLRIAVVLAIVAGAAGLPRVHEYGVRVKSAAYEGRAGGALLGRAAPPVPFAASLHLEQSDLSTLRLDGPITLLNFWATWCGPCVEELPLLERFWKEHRESGVRVVGVTRPYRGRDAGQEAELVREFLSDRKITFPMVVGSRESPAHAAYGIESLPSSVLLDRRGNVVAFGAGIRGSLRLMDQAVELLREGGSASGRLMTN